ncbi:hypothetical protein ACFFU9_07755 [Mariniflexile ostreae]|uniref:Uncharacterized protein n=1 Tax=Mariniflexile ostreae TaxID=1520892 RepID=A0ABV5FB20_9FLAO
MSKSRELKWHEDFFLGIISAGICVTVLFNGFSYLTSLFISEVLEHGKPTKQQALLALFSKVESGWWKYLIVIVFFFIAFSQINAGMKKFKLKNK